MTSVEESAGQGSEDSPGRPSESWLYWLAASRFGVSLAFMMYAGALPTLIPAWSMSASQAGLIQTVFNASYAFSLVLTGWMSDRLGSKHVFLYSSWLAAIVGLCVAIFARSYFSGLLLFSAFGLVLGGTYAPSIMLVSERIPSERRGRGVGLILAGASLGYAGSIALSNAQLVPDYRVCFAICGLAPLGAAAAAWHCSKAHPNVIPPNAADISCAKLSTSNRRWSFLLTFGYAAHCWELLGMWAWMPTFLAATFSTSLILGGPTQGLWIGLSLHISGSVSAFVIGSASDRFGRRGVLITLALLGAACSFFIGWLNAAPTLLILAVSAIYGFAAVGDSPVLSTAMTESVPKDSLGSALALRSLLGFGAGGAAPFAFGLVRDSAMASTGWGLSFTVLGIGGVLAAVSAILLPPTKQTRVKPEREIQKWQRRSS